MGLFGSTQNLPEQKQKPLGVDESRLGSNEQARPVPMLYGRARVGLTFITDFFNKSTSAITQQVGKGTSTTSGYHYYAGIAALLCAGPVDELLTIFVNGEKLDLPNPIASRTGSETNKIVDLGENLGTFRIYWGTDNQPADPNLPNYTAVKNAQGISIPTKHPAYRGVCYVIFDYFYLGANQTNFPNVEFILGRKATPYSNDPLSNDAQPLNAVYDLLTHSRCGAGVPASFINTEMFGTAAGSLNSEKFGISFYISRASEARQALVQIAETVDGFFTSLDGKIGFRLARHPRFSESENPPVITAEDFVSRPQFEPTSWSETPTEVRLKFTNRNKEYKEDMRIWRDQAALNISGYEPKTLNLDRPLITRETAAETAAKIAGQKAAIPGMKGGVTLRLRGNLFDSLAPGNFFRFDYEDRSMEWPLFRVTERVLPGPDKAEFNIRFEMSVDYISKLNGASLDEYLIAGGAGGEEPEGVPEDGESEEDGDPQIVPLANRRVIELPAALCPEGKLSLALLATRAEESASAIDVYLTNVVDDEETSADIKYDLVERIASFALHGWLCSNIAANGNVIDLDTGAIVQLDGIDRKLNDFVSPDLNLHDALSDHYLMIIGNEIFSLAGLRVDEFPEGSLGIFRVYFARGRFATPRDLHQEGAEVFFLKKRDLVALQHPHFAVGNTSRFKLSTVNTETTLALEKIEPLDVTISGFIYKQTPPINLRVNGALSNPSYGTGENVALKWDLTNARQDLSEDPLIRKTVVLELCNEDEEVLHTREVNGTSLTLTYAQLLTLLGGAAINFIVRVKMRTATTFHTLDSDTAELLVTKV